MHVQSRCDGSSGMSESSFEGLGGFRVQGFGFRRSAGLSAVKLLHGCVPADSLVLRDGRKRSHVDEGAKVRARTAVAERERETEREREKSKRRKQKSQRERERKRDH